MANSFDLGEGPGVGKKYTRFKNLNMPVNILVREI